MHRPPIEAVAVCANHQVDWLLTDHCRTHGLLPGETLTVPPVSARQATGRSGAAQRSENKEKT